MPTRSRRCEGCCTHEHSDGDARPRGRVGRGRRRARPRGDRTHRGRGRAGAGSTRCGSTTLRTATRSPRCAPRRAATERLTLATGVIPLDRRPPGEVAEALQSRRACPRAALSIGIGSGGDVAGRARSRAGGYRRRCTSTTRAAVLVGALGPKMRELAAREADGVLLNWVTPRVAAEQAGRAARRPPAPVPRRVVAYARTVVDAAARGRLESRGRRGTPRRPSTPRTSRAWASIRSRPCCHSRATTTSPRASTRTRRRRRTGAAGDHAGRRRAGVPRLRAARGRGDRAGPRD